MKSILITGHKGTIGQTLFSGLQEHYHVTGADLPEHDLTDYKEAIVLTEHQHAVIYLAWNTNSENYSNGKYDVSNSLMFYNIYEAAFRNKVKRLIMASSIHAKDFYPNSSNSGIVSPDSVYGANKIFLEELGKVYSRRGMDVTCVRFGGVNLSDSIDLTEFLFEKIWLSKRDCNNLIAACLDAPVVAGRFQLINAVSDNPEKLHDCSNAVGWNPVDNSAKQLTLTAV
ncbi:NAD-dependent epimerase/dehydratase family protein [Flavitalea sp.]|nr:NAD(P)-dependent oxidoreductase [Flavitalea sp.]